MSGPFAKEEAKKVDYSLLIMGWSILSLSLGAIYSITLVRFGFFIFMGATLLSSAYIISTLSAAHKGMRVNNRTIVIGYAGLFLPLLFFGVQSPQLPFKNIILVIGTLLLIVSVRKIIYSRKSQ